ncbi:exonuclease domain-containing protein [Marinicella sediminis]|uniref:Exonuclease domain-containing protein n=1 Tax=Marinicella sediminis TaxID=1792834 RepID=A0ABV7J7W6_9GAMM|nr:3'-5' exonuclease [Marinicella sediminis]
MDTETTGIDKHDQIIEIAILDEEGNILLDSLVKPTVKVTPNARAVHGISNRDLKNAPGWAEVYEKYLSITEGKTILAYNSKFDKRLMQQSCKANKLVNKRRNWDCIMLAYSEFMGNTKNGWYKWHKLEDAAFNSTVSISNSNSKQHKALYDSGLALGVYMHMKAEVNKYFESDV